MNIADILNGESSDLSNKIAIKSEGKKIERRVRDCIDQIIDFISNEVNFINNGLCYPYQNCQKMNLSSEDKKELVNSLKNSCNKLPEELKKELSDIFGEVKEENKEEKSEEDKEEPKAEVVAVTAPAVEKLSSEVNNIFGY